MSLGALGTFHVPFRHISVSMTADVEEKKLDVSLRRRNVLSIVSLQCTSVVVLSAVFSSGAVPLGEFQPRGKQNFLSTPKVDVDPSFKLRCQTSGAVSEERIDLLPAPELVRTERRMADGTEFSAHFLFFVEFVPLAELRRPVAMAPSVEALEDLGDVRHFELSIDVKSFRNATGNALSFFVRYVHPILQHSRSSTVFQDVARGATNLIG
jgi:hypothetical protein